MERLLLGAQQQLELRGLGREYRRLELEENFG